MHNFSARLFKLDQWPLQLLSSSSAKHFTIKPHKQDLQFTICRWLEHKTPDIIPPALLSSPITCLPGGSLSVLVVLLPDLPASLLLTLLTANYPEVPYSNRVVSEIMVSCLSELICSVVALRGVALHTLSLVMSIS